MNFTDEKFLNFIVSGKTGTFYHIAPHKMLENLKKYIIISSFNFSGTHGNNVYCLDIAEDLSDYPNRIASIILSKDMSVYHYRAYVPGKDGKSSVRSISKEEFFSIIQKVGLEYPLVTNFFLWNQI